MVESPGTYSIAGNFEGGIFRLLSQRVISW